MSPGSPLISGVGSAAAPPPPAEAAAVFGVELDRVIAYADLLCTVGVERGLLGPQEADRIWTRHLLNAALLRQVVPQRAVTIDLGSGAGLPGIPLALARPDVQMTLVEPMLRRSEFLHEVTLTLGLPVEVTRAHAEELPAGCCEVVVARAVAPLARLVPLACRLLRPGGLLLALKGRRAVVEMKEAMSVVREWSADAPQLIDAGTGDAGTTIVRIERTAKGAAR